MNPFTMRSKRLHLITVALACLVFCSCKRETETFQTAPLSDYFPLEVGKYITYRVDSTVFVNFGSAAEIHSYQEKNLIDAKITDALGRESYRVLRYIRDTAGNESWRSAGTYFITPTDKQIEVVENNLRFVKMHLPIRKDFSWKGNVYLNEKPFGSLYNFLIVGYAMDQWDYSYETLNDTFSYQQQNLTDVVKILQADTTFNKLDTIDIVNNQALIPQDAQAVWLRGNANDTVTLIGLTPNSGYEYTTIFNQSKYPASLNKIVIPPGYSLKFQFYNNKWYYSNPIFIDNNKATLPGNLPYAYIFGAATDTVQINARYVDTFAVKEVKIYNKTNNVVFCNFNAATSTIAIPPGFGRHYQLYNGQWRLFDNADVLLNKDPYSSDLPFGSKTYSVEKYGKGIGLVYQEFLIWEYQSPNGSNPNGYKVGFGVKRSMIDHN